MRAGRGEASVATGGYNSTGSDQSRNPENVAPWH
jgi:hypothetical protein